MKSGFMTLSLVHPKDNDIKESVDFFPLRFPLLKCRRVYLHTQRREGEEAINIKLMLGNERRKFFFKAADTILYNHKNCRLQKKEYFGIFLLAYRVNLTGIK
jgi:hypothetical protein